MKKSKEAGFTLIEILVAMAVFSIGLLGTAYMVCIVTRNNAVSKRMTVAATLAQSKLEQLRGQLSPPAPQTENNIDAYGDANQGIYTRETSVDPGPDPNSTYKVTIKVSWIDSKPREMAICSVINR